jgi:hypothetical protein
LEGLQRSLDDEEEIEKYQSYARADTDALQSGILRSIYDHSHMSSGSIHSSSIESDGVDVVRDQRP